MPLIMPYVYIFSSIKKFDEEFKSRKPRKIEEISRFAVPPKF